MPRRSRWRMIALGLGGTLALALVVAACQGDRFRGGATPGGGAVIETFTPTPTLAAPATLPPPTPTPFSVARPTPTRAPGATSAPGGSPTAPPTGGGGDAAAGRGVFTSAGCTACHTIQSVPQARGTIGPNLNTVGAIAGQRVPGKSAEEYLREAELNPGAFVVSGFANVMPKLVEPGTQLDNLVAFLLSLK